MRRQVGRRPGDGGEDVPVDRRDGQEEVESEERRGGRGKEAKRSRARSTFESTWIGKSLDSYCKKKIVRVIFGTHGTAVILNIFFYNQQPCFSLV